MGRLDFAMNILIEMFQKYATKEGDRLHLSRKELRDMFNAELSDLLQVVGGGGQNICRFNVMSSFLHHCLLYFQKGTRDPQKVGVILTSLDQNLDGRVDFEEFVSMVTQLTMCSNAYFKTFYGQCGVR